MNKEVFQEHITARFILRNENFVGFVRYIKGFFTIILSTKASQAVCSLSHNLQFPT